MNHVTHPLSPAKISIFLRKNSKFFYIRKCRYRLHFGTLLLIFLTFFESLNFFEINMVTILMMSTKLTIPGRLKRKIFRNKYHDVTILEYDVINKFLFCVSNYTVDVVM